MAVLRTFTYAPSGQVISDARSGARIEALTTRTTELAARITAHETRIGELEALTVALSVEKAAQEADLSELQQSCAANDNGNVHYLHADHLGRPQFATNSSGAVVWDMGDAVTPFGEGVNIAGAFAQTLMFPGQYADTETGLSHNWHRTYDPTLGRYLQSDPIGLAGGLNRYAYVGGNPVANIDLLV